MKKRKYVYKKPNFFQRNFSFSGKMTAGVFWSEFAIHLISLLCTLIIVCMVLVAVIPAQANELSAIMDIIVVVFGLICLVSITAMSRRRLRDAGFGAKTYLWLLLPIVGWIVFIAKLCAKSVD